MVTEPSLQQADATARAQARQAVVLPPELTRAFRLIVFDWDGTAVTSRTADATAVAAPIDSWPVPCVTTRPPRGVHTRASPRSVR